MLLPQSAYYRTYVPESYCSFHSHFFILFFSFLKSTWQKLPRDTDCTYAREMREYCPKLCSGRFQLARLHNAFINAGYSIVLPGTASIPNKKMKEFSTSSGNRIMFCFHLHEYCVRSGDSIKASYRSQLRTCAGVLKVSPSHTHTYIHTRTQDIHNQLSSDLRAVDFSLYFGYNITM